MRQSPALCVSIMHCDLAVIIRRTAALSMQMLSILSPARSDGFTNSSGFRKQSQALSNTLLYYILLFDTREGKCHGGLTDINMRDCYRHHLESEEFNLDLL